MTDNEERRSKFALMIIHNCATVKERKMKALVKTLGVFGFALGFFLLWNKSASAQPKGPVYSNVRYEDDYGFLANGRGTDPFNQIKKIPLGGQSSLSFGGSYRFRFERDANRRFGASNPQTQSFYLNRIFLFADVSLGSRVRVFGEGKYAAIANNDLPAPLTAEDNLDLQNLFAEVWLVKNDKAKLGLRAGRQEMQFGKQRLVSPLDWVNTRRTFDGGRVTANVSGWKLDGFFTRVVEQNPEAFNRADDSQTFAGAYAQRTFKGKSVSFYYLRLKEDDLLARSGSGAAGDYQCGTVGAGYDGANKNFDWTTEAAYQFGSFSTDDIAAYMLAFEGGYTFGKAWAKPRLALGLDIASGDKDPTDDKKQTFNQLFPLAHPYFGWADQVARQNIQAATLSLTLRPHARVSAKVQALGFRLAQARDAFYNAAGAAVRRSTTGAAGKDLGSEFDAEVTYNPNVHLSVMLGYTRFTPGDFIKQTGVAETHNLFYVMVPVRF
jgi:hypothetical protein